MSPRDRPPALLGQLEATEHRQQEWILLELRPWVEVGWGSAWVFCDLQGRGRAVTGGRGRVGDLVPGLILSWRLLPLRKGKRDFSICYLLESS